MSGLENSYVEQCYENKNQAQTRHQSYTLIKQNIK